MPCQKFVNRRVVTHFCRPCVNIPAYINEIITATYWRYLGFEVCELVFIQKSWLGRWDICYSKHNILVELWILFAKLQPKYIIRVRFYYFKSMLQTLFYKYPYSIGFSNVLCLSGFAFKYVTINRDDISMIQLGFSHEKQIMLRN